MCPCFGKKKFYSSLLMRTPIRLIKSSAYLYLLTYVLWSGQQANASHWLEQVANSTPKFLNQKPILRCKVFIRKTPAGS
jgi:hypothetical protein